MKALSILQPYAWLIAQGIKDVENRTWHTGYRGPVLIHAGKTYPKRDHLDDWESWQHFCYPADRDSMIGGIVGIATITGCVSKSDSKWFNGPWGFTLTNARALQKLIPMRGALGFFDVPPEIEQLAMAALNPWLPMDAAPKDGTEIELMLHHPNRQYAIGDERRRWEQAVRAKWIDFNDGGWTWHGMYGTPQGWRPVA